jgi:LPS export ABC transporter protein LptC
MNLGAAWSAVRQILFWGIPGVLVAVLVWTMLPHGGPRPASPEAGASAIPGPPRGPAPASNGAPSGEDPARTAESPEHLVDSPVARISQGDLVGSDEAGHPRWRVVADDVTVAQDKLTVLLKHVRATFFQPGGQILVTGERGTYHTRTREIDIIGNVHGTSSNGRQLFADRLHWTPGSGTITGYGHIRVMEERVVMYADRMVSNTTLGQTQFFGDVHAVAR